MNHSEKYTGLDLARGLAALAVCGNHLRAAWFVDFGQLAEPRFLDRLFYFATSLGHEAVLIFFVLSGFFVGGSVLRNRDRFAWNEFLFNRVTRLWVVLIPSLILTWGIDTCIRLWEPGILAGQFYHLWASGPQPGQYSNGWTTFLGNVFFLQTILVPIWGTNTPLWSLAYEFWFYVIFPLILTLCGTLPGQKRFWQRGGALVGLGVLAFMLPREMAWGFVFWALGAALHFIPVRRGRPLSLFWGVASTLVLVSALANSAAPARAGLSPVANNALLAFAFALWVWTMIQGGYFAHCSAFLQRGCSRLADISYSLYLLHFPLILLLVPFVIPNARFQPTAFSYAGWFLGFCFLIASGWAFWLCFESRTAWLRQKLRTKFLPQSAPSRP